MTAESDAKLESNGFLDPNQPQRPLFKKLSARHLESKDSKDKPAKVRFPRKIPAVEDHDKHHHEGRTIVVCLDGTGDKFDSDNSNIVHLVSALKKDDKSQVTYYQAGIGTYSQTGLQSGFSAAMDMAVGSELGLHVRDAYDYLMHTYKEGDRICLFGFSRGAYTARCLAGMVHKVGLLPPRNVAQIPFAYEFYKDQSAAGWRASAAFKKTFCVDVNIYFVGVFDSVSSVGVIPRQLPLSSTPTNKVKFFRHAMALDERRAKFKPCRFQNTDWADVEGLAGIRAHAKHKYGSKDGGGGKSVNGDVRDELEEDLRDIDDELELPEAPFDTDFDEVWFLGAHADVGGGAEKNETRHKLSNIPLRWMIRQCFECNTGILFKTKALAEIGLDIHTLWPQYQRLTIPATDPSEQMQQHYDAGLPSKSRRSKNLIPIDHTPHGDGHWDLHIAQLESDEKNPDWLPEQVEDWFDAMAPINDQLAVARVWWILEMWPVEYWIQKAESEDWEVKLGMNLGRYRGVYDHEPQMHWTVQSRMKTMAYEIQARYGRNAMWHLVA